MSSSFTQKKIDITINLGTGVFGESGTDTVKLSGHRVIASIEKALFPWGGQAQIRIYGLTPSLISQLSALNAAAMVTKKNSIAIEAGDENGMSLIFQGQIQVAQAMLNMMPDSPLAIVAASGAYMAVKTIGPTSYKGSVSAALIAQNIARFIVNAQEKHVQFVNWGVNTQLSNPYFTGSPLTQLQECADAGRFNYDIDNDTVHIWPIDGAKGGEIPLISPETGMIGYPDYTTSTSGCGITTLFNPFLQVGGQVQIQSNFTPANGIWYMYGLRHELESELPGGKWFTHFDAGFKNEVTAP